MLKLTASTKYALSFCFLLKTMVGFSQFEFGQIGGVNYSIMNTVNKRKSVDFPLGIFPTKWKPSFHVGFYGSYALSDKFSLVAELLFSGKGYGRRDIPNQNLYYLSLPIISRASISKKVKVDLGPEFSILLPLYDNIWHNDLYRKTDFGMTLGLNYLLNERMSIGIRYCKGIVNILSKTAGFSATPGNPGIRFYDSGTRYYNQAFHMSVAYVLLKQNKKSTL